MTVNRESAVLILVDFADAVIAQTQMLVEEDVPVLGYGIELGLRIALERPEYAQAIVALTGRLSPHQLDDVDAWIRNNPLEVTA